MRACYLLFLIVTATVASSQVSLVGPRVLCEGTSATLEAPANMINYFWSTGQTSRTIEVFAAGRYTCRVTTQMGNIDSGAIELAAGFRPRPKIGNPIEYLCEGDQANLEAPSTFSKYIWSTGETTSSITVTTEGDYWLTVTDTNGCTGQSDKVHIQVFRKPVVTIKGQDAVCPGRRVQYSVAATPGTSYQWFCDGGLINSGQGTNSVHITWTRTGTIRLRASSTRPDGGICSADTLVPITVSTRLRPQLQYQSNSVCIGDTIILVAAEGYASYKWSTGSAAQYIKVTKGGPYWVEVTDSSGCTGVTDTLTVLEYVPPTTSIRGPVAVCEGASVTLEAISASNDVVVWQWNTGQRTKQITVSTGGKYSVIGWTLDGCKDTAYYTLLESPKIDVSAGDVNVGTVPTGIPIGASVVVVNNGKSDISVMKCVTSLPANVTPSLPRFIPIARNQTFTIRYTPTVEGPFYLELTWIIASADCSDTIVTIVEGVASGDPPIGSVTISIPDTTVAVGQPVQLPVKVTWAFTSPMSTSLEWSVYHPSNALLFQGASGCRVISTDKVGLDQRIMLSLDQLPTNSGDTTIFLNCIPLLQTQFVVPVVPLNAMLDSGLLALFDYNDGSITITGCWLPGRLIQLGLGRSQMSLYSLSGELLHSAPIEPGSIVDIPSVFAQHPNLPAVVAVQLVDSGGMIQHRGVYLTKSISR